LRASNFINSRLEYSGFTQTPDYKLNSNSSMIGRNFGFSVSYKFGKLKDQIKKVERTITNDDVKGGNKNGSQ